MKFTILATILASVSAWSLSFSSPDASVDGQALTYNATTGTYGYNYQEVVGDATIQAYYLTTNIEYRTSLLVNDQSKVVLGYPPIYTQGHWDYIHISDSKVQFSYDKNYNFSICLDDDALYVVPSPSGCSTSVPVSLVGTKPSH